MGENEVESAEEERGKRSIKLAEEMIEIVRILAPIPPRGRRRILVFLADAAGDLAPGPTNNELEAIDRVAEILGIDL